EDGIRDFHVTGVQTCALPILAVLVAGAALVLDHATVLAALRRLEVPPATANALGAGLGAVLLGGVWSLSGAELPFLGPAGALAAGAALGLVTVLLADRLRPVGVVGISAGWSVGVSKLRLLGWHGARRRC